MEKKKRKKSRFLRIAARILLGFFIFLVLLVLFIRSPWGQGIIIGKVTSYVSGKTNTRVEIEKLYITFSGGVTLDGLYMEDKAGDTLIYSRSLKAEVPLGPVLFRNKIVVNRLEWDGLKAGISRKDSVQGFNFQFLIDAFASEDTTAVESSDTTATIPEIHLDNIRFTDFDLAYKDDVNGMDTRLKLGELFLRMKETDVEKMHFHVANATIRETEVRYLQTLPFPENDIPEEEEESPSLYIAIDNFDIESLLADYRSVPDGLEAKADIGRFNLKLPEADIAGNSIDVYRVFLGDSDLSIKMVTKSDTDKNSLNQDITNKEDTSFEWPDWKIRIGEVRLDNNNIRYAVNGALPKQGLFNADAITLEEFYFLGEDIFLKDRSAGLKLETFRFREASGLNLKEFALAVQADDRGIEISDLQLFLNNNRIRGNTALKYATLNEFIKHPEKTGVTLNLPDFILDTKDAFYFQPDLKENEYMQALGKNTVTGTLEMNGSMATLHIPVSDVGWGKNTGIRLRGTLHNVTEPDSLRFDLPEVEFHTIREDMLSFVNEEDLGIHFPDTLVLAGNAKGSTQIIDAVLDLRTTDGAISFAGNFANVQEKPFDADMEVKGLHLEKLLQNPKLGPLDLTLKASGKLRDVYSMDVLLDANVSRLALKDYHIENLPLKGDIKAGKGSVTSVYKDQNIDVTLESEIELDSVSPRFIVDLDLKGADLQALGLMDRSVRSAMKLHADFKGNADRFTLSSNITDGIAVYDQNTYPLGDLSLKALADKDTTSLEVKNKMLDMELYSNIGPEGLGKALQRHFRSLLSNRADTVFKPSDSLKNTLPLVPAELRIKARMTSAPILSDIFLTGLKKLDTVKIDADFRERERYFVADIQMPHINYNGNEIDSLLLRVDSGGGELTGHFGFKELKAGPVAIQNTALDGRISNRKLFLDFNAFHEEEKLVAVQTEVSRDKDSLRVHINPVELILNKKPWNIPASNEITVYPKVVQFRDFRIERNGQQLEIQSAVAEGEGQKDNIAVAFRNFRLASFLSYLNPEETLANGVLNGNIIAEDPFGKPGFLADLKMEDLEVMNAPLGTLSLNAESPGGEKYDFNLALKGGDIDMDMAGSYETAETGKLQLNMDLNSLKTTLAEAFVKDQITESGGYVSGKMEVSGTVADPVYKGSFKFNDVRFRVTMLNTLFRLPGETLDIDNKGLFLDNFTIADENDNKFFIDGNVLTENILNPAFDLQLKAKNFRALHSKREDNDLFFGKAFFDVDAAIKGNLRIPKVDMKLRINSDTDVTYIVPESELDIVERDGVVIFVNREDPDDILTKTKEESVTVSGFELNSLITVDDNAVFNVIINEQTNDNLRVAGGAELTFNLYPNGRTTLSGKYTLKEGHYELNLYNLVKRKFNIIEGSSVTWAGDPLDADLDVKAMYEVKASASALLAMQNTTAPSPEKDKFRQQLPFIVYLNIAGELMTPQLSFNLDMPEDNQGAIGGQVYSRVQQLNQQEDELNKQVFSLLVFNRFFLESGNFGTSGGATAIARDNLNQALSGQLNALSDKLLGESGVELDFGLDSYTDYQGSSPQDRTQLDITARKKLFDDRVIISVGSEVDIQGSNQEPGQENPLIGNVSIEYLLTEDGRYRLKGFRKNEYQNIIDGQLIVNGIALIFTREFNKYRELFKKTAKEKEEESEADIKKKQEEENKEKEKEREKEQGNNEKN
ncbi:translocation/assembly module TamB domain-containing protein [Sinomicrobium sp. M5D2P9]